MHHAIAWAQGGPHGTRFLPMGVENRHFFGPVRYWVNTGLPLSLRTNNTVIDMCFVLSPYFCVNGELESVLINRIHSMIKNIVTYFLCQKIGSQKNSPLHHSNKKKSSLPQESPKRGIHPIFKNETQDLNECL